MMSRLLRDPPGFVLTRGATLLARCLGSATEDREPTAEQFDAVSASDAVDL